MALKIHCYEPQSTPRQISLVFDEPRSFALYALQDNLSEDARDLRSTILRRLEEHPPPNSVLLFEAEIRASRPGELPTLRVTKAGGRAMIELIRPDSRGRVTKGTDIKSGLRFEATLRDLRTISFSLEIESDSVSGKGAMAGSRPTGSMAVAGIGSLIWVVPTIAETLMEPRAKLVAWLVATAKRLGISSAIITPMLLMSAMFIGVSYVAYQQFSKGQTLQEELTSLQEKYDAASTAKDAAIQGQELCRQQRIELTKKLDQIDETRKLQADVALNAPLTHVTASELGGGRMSAPEAMAFDEKAMRLIQKVIVSSMASERAPRDMAKVCRGQEVVLGQDLPKYVLTWHPDPEQLCPDGYGAVLAGVDIAGPWGLSPRVVKDFGELADAGDNDIRLNETWSGNTLAAGVRAVFETLMAADTGDRPPTAPGQAHLWALALFDAYNRLPSPAGGTMDRHATACVAELVDEVARSNVPAEPGQPVMPSIVDIAAGDPLLITPGSGCPWPSDALNQGAASALRAVTQLALIQLAVEEGEGEEDEG